MANEDTVYAERLATLQAEVLEFLRTFESIQEGLLPGILRENQARLVSAVRDTFRRFDSSFAPLTPPAGMTEVHRHLCEAIGEFGKAYDLFMSQPGPQWTLMFLHSRSAFSRGLYRLYELRDQLPVIGEHFLLDGATAPVSHAAGDAATGFIHRKRNDQRSDYSLYIPEDYSRDKPLPLIIALHGGYGQGSSWTYATGAASATQCSRPSHSAIPT